MSLYKENFDIVDLYTAIVFSAQAILCVRVLVVLASISAPLHVSTEGQSSKHTFYGKSRKGHYDGKIGRCFW